MVDGKIVGPQHMLPGVRYRKHDNPFALIQQAFRTLVYYGIKQQRWKNKAYYYGRLKKQKERRWYSPDDRYEYWSQLEWTDKKTLGKRIDRKKLLALRAARAQAEADEKLLFFLKK